MFTENRRSRSGRVKTRDSHSGDSQFKKHSPSFSSRRPSRTKNEHYTSRTTQSRTRGGRQYKSFDPTQFINTNPTDAIETVYTPTHRFSDFGLNDILVRTITSLGLVVPSPIQDQIIPEIMNGRDVVGLAETGTGKTAAFLLPLIEKTLKSYNRQTLIVTPTRELAIQIEAELQRLVKGFKLFSVTCVGGVNIRPQISMLRKKNHFIIGTPGRILDLIERGHFQPSLVTTVVLDEADRMLDMGFINPIREILKETPADRETLFFSATMDKKTQDLVHDFLKNPITISVKKKDTTDSIKQDVIYHGHHDKFEVLTKLLSDSKLTRVIIFGSMKHSVEKLSKQLSEHGIRAESIHGNKNHTQRQRSLQNFKNGHVRVLVATDVAARGIHIDDVSHVINYDLPSTFEDYIHRIGRTGRGMKRGQALTFVVKAHS